MVDATMLLTVTIKVGLGTDHVAHDFLDWDSSLMIKPYLGNC